MIGPVQEKDTSTRVSAIKKMPTKLVVPARASDMFIQDDGRLISKAPRNEITKMTNKAKYLIHYCSNPDPGARKVAFSMSNACLFVLTI